MTIGAGTVSWRAGGLGPGGSHPLQRGPLDGVKVVELATFFAAPYANRFLRDLGAEVVKVEAPSGDPMRSLPDPFEGASRGKRSIALDLKASEARPVIEALLDGPDVVQHNFRPGVAERLRLDEATVRSLNPDVIHSYAPGFRSTGPKSGMQSFAPLHSGFVGVYWEASGEGNTPMQSFGNEDYYNGQLNAVGVLLALLHRARTGEGQGVECAQLSSSVFVTSHWYRAGGEPRTTIPGWTASSGAGRPTDASTSASRATSASSAWTTPSDGAFRRAVLGDGEEEGDGERLDDEMFSRPAADWAVALQDEGVPCAVVAEESWLLRFLRDEQAIAAGRATPFDHVAHGPASAIGRIVQLRGWAPLEPVRAAGRAHDRGAGRARFRRRAGRPAPGPRCSLMSPERRPDGQGAGR